MTATHAHLRALSLALTALGLGAGWRWARPRPEEPSGETLRALALRSLAVLKTASRSSAWDEAYAKLVHTPPPAAWEDRVAIAKLATRWFDALTPALH